LVTAAEAKQLSEAYRELRRALVKGAVAKIEELGARIGLLLGDEQGELAPGTLHREAIGWLQQGIAAILAGGNQHGLVELERVTERELDNESLRWGAWLWSYWATLGAGEVERARAAVGRVMELAERLDDPYTMATSLCAVAEVEAIGGDPERAVEHLTRAEELYGRLEDRRGEAAAALARARALVRAGRTVQAAIAAQRAMDLAPGWEEPAIFLATQALQEGMLEPAAQRLSALEPRPPEASLLLGLIATIQEGRVPHWVAKDYLRLREALPSQDVAEELGALLVYSPKFHHLKLELAWKLLRLGKLDEAEGHLRQLLAAPDLDAAVRPSVLLGIGSVASLRQRHRPPGARVQAAVASLKPPSVELPASLPVEDEPESHELVAEPPGPGELPPAVVGAAEGGAPGGGEARDLQLRRAFASVEGQRSVFSGDLHVLSTPDLLEFLRNGRRTGMLIIQASSGIGAIHLRAGAITGASSPGCTNIGDILLGLGAITRSQLVETAAAQQEDRRGALLGALFVERGIVSRETMEKALTRQVLSAIREMHGWSEGRFAFLADTAGLELAPPPSIEMELDTQFVLLEVARLVDEENRG
jgi:tetratricopeptide (TPR) repeat protein